MRVDGPDKLTGRTRYLDDLPAPGAWHGATVRSPMPRGRIREIRFDPSINWSGFTVVDHRSIPGQNVGAMFDDRQPVLAVDEVRHPGEAILLLAHPSRRAVRAAARAVTLVIDPLPADLEFRLPPAPGAIQVGSENLLHRTRCLKGDPLPLLEQAERIITGCYFTGGQEHVYLEPQAMMAGMEDGVLTVRGSMQCPYYALAALRRVMGEIPVRAIATPVGGGFGGKEDYPSVIAAHATLLAHASGRPVKLVYDRAEDMAWTSKRHPAQIRHRTAVDADGTLLAMDIEVLFDAGAYATLSPIVLSRATIHATGPYRCPHVRITGRARLTNTVPNGAFRGFGNPQVAFAVERHMDRIAEALGLDPVVIRRRNLLRDGDPTATGQRMADGVDTDALLDRAMTDADRAAMEERHTRFNQENVWRKRAWGAAASFHGTGLPAAVEQAIGSRLEIVGTEDGGVRLHSSIVEMGQGVDTIFTRLAADRLGLDPDEVSLASADTALVPDTGPSVASRTSMVVGLLVEQACDDLRRELDLEPGKRGDLVRQAIRDRITGGAGPPVGSASYQIPDGTGVLWDPERFQGEAYPAYAWAVQVAEVEVDLRTGATAVLDLVSVQDVGTVLHPALARGQVQGGVAQAVGWALTERVALDDGAMANPTLRDYVIPTAVDLPPIRVEFVETPSPLGARGARGLGELPMVGPAGAIANAISRAIGRQVDRIPATPEDILALLADEATA